MILTASANFTPAAAAYDAGDVMDVAKEFVFAASTFGAPMIRILSAETKIDVTAVPSGQTSYTLHLYSVTPPSAQADSAAWNLASADLPSYRGSLNLGTPIDLGAALYVKQQYLDLDVRLAGTSLFGRLVTAGAHTAAAVARGITLHAVLL